MGIRSIFFVILDKCPLASQPNRIKSQERLKRQTPKYLQEFACSVTGESWVDGRNLKNRRGELGKCPPLLVQSRLRIDCPPHQMQHRTIAMLGKPNKINRPKQQISNANERNETVMTNGTSADLDGTMGGRLGSWGAPARRRTLTCHRERRRRRRRRRWDGRV